MEILVKIIVIVLAAGITLLLFKYLTAENRNTAIGKVKKQKNFIIKILVVIVVCSIALFLTNTVTKTLGKDSYINNFEEFVEKVKVNHKEYSEDDWIKIDEEYHKFEEEDRIEYEKFFTKEDKTRVNTLIGEYSSCKVKGTINDIYETIKDGVDSAVEYIDGFVNGLNNTIESDSANE